MKQKVQTPDRVHGYFGQEVMGWSETVIDLAARSNPDVGSTRWLLVVVKTDVVVINPT